MRRSLTIESGLKKRQISAFNFSPKGRVSMPRRYSKKNKRGAPEIQKSEEVCPESPMISMEDEEHPRKQYSKSKAKKKGSPKASAEKPLWSDNPASVRRVIELKTQAEQRLLSHLQSDM